MPRKRARRTQIQLTMWIQESAEPQPKGEPESMRHMFGSNPVRTVTVDGRLWFVLKDIAKILKYRDAADASKILKDHQKGTQKVRTPGGTQEMLVVSEGGVNRLINRSSHPEAEKIQDWIEEEVVPSILRTGSYSIKPKGRVATELRRLGCDVETAKVRCDQFETNKAIREEFLADGGCVNDIVDYHEIAYRNEFGKSAAELRAWVGAKEGQTPLDYMAFLPLSINQHSKAIAAKMVEVAEGSGLVVSPSMRVQWFGEVVTKIKDESLNHFNGGEFQVVEDSKRGRVIDLVVNRPLAESA